MGVKLPVGDMGPCEIVWGYGESAAMYLGDYLGDVKLTMETNTADIQEEAAGDAAVDAVFMGSVMNLEIPLARVTAAQLNEVLLSGGVLGHGTGEYLKLKNAIGCDLYSLAKSIVIKPICGNVVSIDPSEWIQLYKCYPVPGMDLTFNRSTQRIFPTKFKIFVSQESGFVGEFGTLGMASGSTEFGI
jgi:hypothetical protein